MHVYQVRPRKDKRGVDLISDVLPFGRLWYSEPNAISNAIGHAKFYSRSHHAVISVYDATGKAIETHEQLRFGQMPQANFFSGAMPIATEGRGGRIAIGSRVEIAMTPAMTWRAPR